ncbi:MAG: energy transducer TonB [Marinilabiliaceae bacterium]|nr:energy transducer TonB [Marinilabiliaceae bacterium]
MNVRYPISAQVNGLQARCYISFIVDTEVNIKEIYSANQTYPILIKEAVRAESGMPQWKPGMQDGKPVKVSYTVPINFVLQ